MAVTGQPLTKDQEIAETLRYCALHTDTEDEERLVAWVTEHLADALARRDSRFARADFMQQADWRA